MDYHPTYTSCSESILYLHISMLLHVGALLDMPSNKGIPEAEVDSLQDVSCVMALYL